MWSQDLFLTLSDHRDVCVRVMRVLGGPGRTVPFLEQFLPCRTQAFAQLCQSKGLLLHHLRGGAPHKCEVVPKLTWHHCQEITTRGALCLKK